MNYEVKRREKIFTPDSHFAQCHASTLAILANGEVLAAWFAGTAEKDPDVAIWMARRTQDGWGEPVVVADMEGVACWNPVLFSPGEDQVILYYKVGPDVPNWKTMVIRSLDGGKTWTTPEELVEGDVGGRGPVKNKPIILLDGTWVAPASVETKDTWEAFVDISQDQGKTWTRSETVPLDRSRLHGKGVIQPTLWESKPGVVHMLLRSTEGKVLRSDSQDGGQTWCQAYAAELPNNNSGLDLVGMEDKTLVLVYNPVEGNWAARTPIVAALSRDNGESWQTVLTLDDGEGEFSYPSIVSQGSDVHLTYTWKRKTVAYWQISLQP